MFNERSEAGVPESMGKDDELGVRIALISTNLRAK
jgi:hypothetical protein